MTVTFLLKTKLLQDDEKNKMRWELKLNDDEIKYSKMHFIMMKHWQSKNTFESHLNQIWVRQNEMKMRHDKAKYIL